MDDCRIRTYRELTERLGQLASAHPDLVRLTSLTATPGGRTVWCLEVAAGRDRRPAHRRPGLLVQGNLHAVEFAGSVQGLYLLGRLLEGYPGEPAVRRLLDEQVVYVIPRVDPDGSDYILRTGHRIRNRLTLPREPNVAFPQDLNGDGRIATMRWQAPEGSLKPCPEDPRLLVSRRPEDTGGPFYCTADEGLIHDWDGGPVQGSRARCDLNRNFPAGWRPSHGNIGWEPYPLSARETRAVADFVLAHPNITRVLDFHTGNPALFHPSALIPGESGYPEDAQLYRRIGGEGEAITGFRYLSGYSEGWQGTHTERLPGAFKDWLYEHTGAVALIVEMGMHYNGLGLDDLQRAKPPAQREEADGLAQLAWHDAHPEAGLFVDWQPFDHPQLGPVEIGGWNYVLWSNPPPETMPDVCRRGTEFLLRLADYRPCLAIEPESVERLGGDLFRVAVRVRNTGLLSTAGTRQAHDTHPRARPVVTLHAEGEVGLVSGKQATGIDHLPAGTGLARVAWVFRTRAASVVVGVDSDRGVHDRLTVRLDAAS